MAALSKYGTVAVEAARLSRSGVLPSDAWDLASSSIFCAGTSSQVKGCPRGAFLGLASAGLLRGVKSGNYTRSKKNAHYAVEAAGYLLRNPDFIGNPAELWSIVMNGLSTVHNSQMDVVIALWRTGDVSKD